jgi:hypothetical protein
MKARFTKSLGEGFRVLLRERGQLAIRAGAKGVEAQFRKGQRACHRYDIFSYTLLMSAFPIVGRKGARAT